MEATNYYNEFELGGYKCFQADNFYLNDENIAIIGCCTLLDCKYFPFNTLEGKALNKDKFNIAIKTESARQNIVKYGISEESFRFIGFTDVCELIDAPSFGQETFNGIVDISDSSIKYIVNDRKIISGVHTSAEILRATKLASSFNLGRFIFSGTCYKGNAKEKEILRLLSECQNNIIKLKLGITTGSEVSDYSLCVAELDDSTKEKEGFVGSITNVFYFISSFLTGGNIREFVQSNLKIYQQYSIDLRRDVINPQKSLNDFSDYSVKAESYLESLKTANNELNKRLPFFKRVRLYFLSIFYPNSEDQFVKINNHISEARSAIDKHMYKTAYRIIDQTFIDIQTASNYRGVNILCQFMNLPYPAITQVNQSYLESYNFTVLFNELNREPEIEFNNSIGLIRELKCTENCTVIIGLKNYGDPATADLNVSFVIVHRFNDQYKFPINFTISDVTYKEGIARINYTFANPDLYFKEYYIEDVKSLALPKENKYYKNITIESWRINWKLIEQNTTEIERWRICQ